MKTGGERTFRDYSWCLKELMIRKLPFIDVVVILDMLAFGCGIRERKVRTPVALLLLRPLLLWRHLVPLPWRSFALPPWKMMSKVKKKEEEEKTKNRINKKMMR